MTPDIPLETLPSQTTKSWNVATGFTTAFLGDERSLREFIVGDFVKRQLEQEGQKAVLYLLNDTYDPLNYRQLRIGVHKDERLLERFKPFCGRPIAEIPDPFDCHDSYAQHYLQALLTRLRDLGIEPVVLDTYDAYQQGLYQRYTDITFRHYNKIQDELARCFHSYTVKTLFHAQCPECRYMDAAHIWKVDSDQVHMACDRCGTVHELPSDKIPGKLSWKLDCAARWNIYDIDREAFSKAHLAELGSYEISRFLSQEFFEGKVPKPIPYGHVTLSRELSGLLSDILPPDVLRDLFISRMTRDITIDKETVATFCQRYAIRPGLSYTDFIRRELPVKALQSWQEDASTPDTTQSTSSQQEERWIRCGNAFSRFYYNKEFRLSLPTQETLLSGDTIVIASAREILTGALSLRRSSQEGEALKSSMAYLLHGQTIPPHVYPYLRRILGPVQGPTLLTLLMILPEKFLDAVNTLISSLDGKRPEGLHVTAEATTIRNDREIRPDTAEYPACLPPS